MTSSSTSHFSLSCFSPSNLHFSSQTKPPKPVKQRVITGTISEKPPISPPEKPSKHPIRNIPGDYGLPLIGAWKDRQDYFYNQGTDEFFKSRIQKYQSTVFRTNMPPGPFISSNPNVVALLDGKSFPALFDTDKVEKRDVFTGTFMPSTDLTGGYRILSYLDPSEPNHAKLKKLVFFLLSYRRDHVLPEFHASYTDMFEALEAEIAANGKASVSGPNDAAAFNFLARAFYGVNPNDTKLGPDGPTIIALWVLFQLHPIISLGLPRLIEDPLLHTFSLPSFLIKAGYNRLYDFFFENSAQILDHAENTLGLARDEACHNLLFATCFNTFGGMKIFFPSLLKLVGGAGPKLHLDLAREIRMPLMKSVVYEALRIEPPVPAQYAKAKKDFVVESHDAAFAIKEGEMLYGYQPLATKDPKIFDRAEEFIPDRFVGEEGEKLLKHVLWSNGPETESPSVENKQCAGKEFVVLIGRLLLVELFLRYDSFEIDGTTDVVTSLKRASF
ncbi:hypothetical protein SASPL_135385 [Salvia splendens]|uniref:Hydroperoxide dehydratase n=1 Tax=Salvia splendens TaxID=180675 RepID=A0A8X8ZFX4_SALSN|nr:hypothetical protein SASPL_135385 [Salvia splendens]